MVKGEIIQKKKLLPERKNRGLRMAELAKNEEKMNENDMYQGIFKEDSSDDDFNPDDKNIEEEDSEGDQKEIEEDKEGDDDNDYDDEDNADDDDDELSINESIEEEEEEDVIKKRSSKQQKGKPNRNGKNKAKAKGKQKTSIKEVFDIDDLDIDRIDFVEEMKDKGIDISDISDITGEMDDDEKYQSGEGDNEEDEEERLNKKKKKAQFDKITKKPKKKKRSFFTNKKPKPKPKTVTFKDEAEQEEEDYEEEVNLKSKSKSTSKVKGKDKDKKKGKYFEENIEDSDESHLKMKRKRTNKFESFLKKSKREKLNKNVQILGSRQNPRAIAINKKIYLPEEDESVINAKSNEDKALVFNLEQELDTKSIIQKFKQQEKDKKTFNIHEKIISQEERLLESIFTEWANKNSLKEMQKLDDINKRESTTNNKKSFINYIKIKSKKNNNENEANKRNIVTLLFSKEDHFNQMFSYFNTKPEVKEKRTCAITGQPAKYYDPLTKSYYASVEAFKLLREKYYQKEEEGLLFRIQTLSDLASQKKERLKKMLLTEDSSTNINATNANANTSANTNTNATALNDKSNTVPVNNEGILSNANANGLPSTQGATLKDNSKANAILNIVNKYGILKNDPNDFDKKVISHRIYNRNRENCLESGMLLEANKIKLVISKKIFKDKFSSKMLSSTGEETAKPVIASSTVGPNKFF